MTFLLLLSKIKLYGFEVINTEDFLELAIRFAFNIGVILLLVRWLYYSNTRRKDYLFTYILIGTIVFILCQMLENVKLDLGFALGLFAVFGILRYRTDQIPIREMTYLFMVIGISVVNALANKKVSMVEQIFTNGSLIAITYGLERVWLLRHESAKTVIYEKIHLIKQGKRDELIADLQERTGIAIINRYEIGQIDFLRDTCKIKIYYFADNINRADQENTATTDDY